VGQRLCRVANQDRMQRNVKLLGKAVAQREHLERQVVQLAAIVLDDSQDHDGMTPSFWRTSTSFGAASGPRPRISPFVPFAGGSLSRSFSRAFPRGSGRIVSIGARLALRRPGTVG